MTSPHTACMRTACPHSAAYILTSEVFGIEMVLHLCDGHTARTRAVRPEDIKSVRSMPREVAR